jgi:hypothetical protein
MEAEFDGRTPDPIQMKNAVATFFSRMQAGWISQPTAEDLGLLAEEDQRRSSMNRNAIPTYEKCDRNILPAAASRVGLSANGGKPYRYFRAAASTD